MPGKSVVKMLAVAAVCGGSLIVGFSAAAQTASPLSSPSPSAIVDANSRKAAESPEPYDPGFTEEHIAYMEAQVPLIDLIDEIGRLAPEWGGGSLEGARIDPPANIAYLHWYGEVPDQLVAFIKEAATRGIIVIPIDTPYTSRELSDAANRIIDAVGSVESLVIGSNTEGTGVEIQYPGADGVTTIDGITYDAIDKLRAAAEAEEAASGIPVAILPGSPLYFTARANDS